MHPELQNSWKNKSSRIFQDEDTNMQTKEKYSQVHSWD